MTRRRSSPLSPPPPPLLPIMKIFNKFSLILVLLLCWLLLFCVSVLTVVCTSAAVNHHTNIANAFCNFDLDTKPCEWKNIEKWQWIQLDSYNNLQLGSPPSLNWANKALIVKLNQSDAQAYLTSPVFTLEVNVNCFLFYYYVAMDKMSPNAGLTLQLISKQNKIKDIWFTAGIEDDQWNLARVQIEQNDSFQLQFNATTTQGFVAITEFMLRDGQCHGANLCDFESGTTCGWSNTGKTKSYSFRVIQANSIKTIRFDHSSHAPYGHVAYLGNGVADSEASLSSIHLSHLGSQCFSFWFYRTGTGVQLQLIWHLDTEEIRSMNLLWTSNVTHLAGEWIRVQMNINLEPVYSILELKAIKLDESDSELAIDDLGFITQQCDLLVSCNFNTGLCAWTEVANNELTWALGPGRVLNASKLTTKKRLTSNPANNVLYTDFTGLKSIDDHQAKMELLSQFVSSPKHQNGACVSIQYLMQTFSPGDRFEVSQIDLDGNRNLLWKFSTQNKIQEENPIWKLVYIYVPNAKHNSSYRFSLLAASNQVSTYFGVASFDYKLSLDKCKPNLSTPTSMPTSTLATVAPSAVLNCDFEQNNACNWHSKDNSFRVGTSISAQLDPLYKPLNDHTTLRPEGHFAYTHRLDQYVSVKSILQASNPYTNVAEICFEFYYYFYATGIANFSLSLDHQDISTFPIFRAYGAIDDKWRKASFSLKPNSTFNKFTFQAYVLRGVLAIDDIKVEPHRCEYRQVNNYFCDFESNTACFIKPIYDGSTHNWDVHQGREWSNQHVTDHSTHTVDGHFYGIDLNKWDNFGASKEIRAQTTASFALRHINCLQFSYYLANVQPNTTLQYGFVGTHDNDFSRPVWKTAGGTHGLWFTHQAQIDLNYEFYTNFNVRFSVHISDVAQHPTGLVLIDDVRVDDTSCDLNTCTFDEGDTFLLEPILVGKITLDPEWKKKLTQINVGSILTTEYLTGDVDQSWIVFSPHQIPNKYVNEDHTLKTIDGKYLLLRADNNYDRGIFVTPRLSLYVEDAKKKNKVSFSFALNKPTATSVFEIYQGESFNETHGVKLWNLTRATQESKWEVFCIDAVPQYSSSVDLFFFLVGTINDASTFIAFDDFQILDKVCDDPSNQLFTPTHRPGEGTTATTLATTVDPNNYFRCSNGVTKVTEKKMCDWVYDCPRGEDEYYCGSCDFANHGLCRYTVNSDNYDNQMQFKFNDQTNVGPSDSPDGEAAFLVASGQFGVATLKSPIIHQAYMGCMLYFYYQYNSTETINNDLLTSMVVYLELTDQYSQVHIWDSTYQRYDRTMWYQIDISLSRVRHPFRIGFMATQRDYQYRLKYHAVSTIELQNCEPTPPGKVGECQEFTCANKVCVPQIAVCDFVDDCGDNSDEMSCDISRMTSFEYGFARWGEVLHEKWRLVNAKQFSQLREGPTYDHTTGFMQGSFLYVNASYANLHGFIEYAQIDSPTFQVSSQGCSVVFYLFKNTPTSTLLVVLQTLHNGTARSRQTIQRVETLSYWWLAITVDLSFLTLTKTYKLILAATLPTQKDAFVSSFVAIDDISFSKDCIILDQVVTQPTNIPGHSTLPPNSTCDTVLCPSAKTKGQHQICLRAHQYCDFVQDCIDGQDEMFCGDCDFDHEDNDTCQWETKKTHYETWQVVRPASSSPGDLPKVDGNLHTNGGYVSIYSDNAQNSHSLIGFFSPTINGETLPQCKLRFSYNAKEDALFFVKIQSSDNWQDSVFEYYDSVPQWKSFSVDIGRQKPGFRIILAASSDKWTGDYQEVAVDNLKLDGCGGKHSTNVTTNSTINCDFEQDLCAWEVIGPQKRSKWFRNSNANFEPGNDHTSLQVPRPAHFGTWLTSQAVQNGESEMDYLITMMPLKTGQQYCFTFWYYFFGIETSTYLALFASFKKLASLTPMKDSNYEALWQITTPQVITWAQAQVEIPAQDKEIYLVFVSYVTPTTVVGLDDFTLSNGTCSVDSPLYCDFEVNTCDWQITNWKRVKAKVSPRIDHTSGTEMGYYLQDFAIGKSASIVKKLNNLPSEVMIPDDENSFTTSLCLRLFYYMQGVTLEHDSLRDRTTNLSIIIQSNKEKSTQNVIITDVYNSGLMYDWIPLAVDFKIQNSYVNQSFIQITGNVKDKDTELFLDDISITNHCETDGDCDFENDLCGWHNVQVMLGNKRILWLRIQPRTVRIIKGYFLKFDHTKGEHGNYLVMPLQMQDHAHSLFQSPVIHRKSTKICFHLWYYVRAAQPCEAFRLKLIDLSNEDQQPTVISVEAYVYYDPIWTEFVHEFDNIPVTYRIDIEAHYNESIRTNICIDDIKIIHHSCTSDDTATTTTPVPNSEKVLDCNFDTPPCNWDYDHQVWNVTDYSDESSVEYYTPHWDHTYQNFDGKYLLFNRPISENVSTFVIKSHHELDYVREHCITFWYYEDGEDWFIANVFLLLPEKHWNIAQFSRSIENRGRWNLIKADVFYDPIQFPSVAKKIQLSIDYKPSLVQFSIFALDDIIVRPGKCAHRYNYVYTFAIGFDDLRFEVIKPLRQEIGQLVIPKYTKEGAPKVDHTTNTKMGQYFLFMNVLRFADATYIDTISIMHVPADVDQLDSCVRFAYQIKGNVTLRVIIMQIDDEGYDYANLNYAWTSHYDKTVWTVAEFNKHIVYEHKIVFYMEKIVDHSSFVALDDLVVLDHKCQLPIDCDFEDGHICSYSTLQADTYNWGVFTAPPSDKNWPGPWYDHTKNSYGGGYLFLTAYRSTGTFLELIAKVISGPRELIPSKSYCLTIYTQLTTPDLELRLHLVRFGSTWTDSNRTVQLTSVAGVNQSSWVQLSLNVNQQILQDASEVQFIIEGRIGTNSRGLIAIDDIRLVEGECSPSNGLVCENGIKITNDKLCNFHPDCPSSIDESNCGQCNFEMGLCGWTNMTSYKQNWLLTTPPVPNKKYAPKFDADHKINGHYLLVGMPTDTAFSGAEMAVNYATPSMYLKNAFKDCVMQFEYFINSTANFEFMIRVGENDANWATVYALSNEQITHDYIKWLTGYAHIGSRYTSFMVDIVGYLSNGFSDVIALDNIAFVNCSMPTPLGPKAVCGKQKIMCLKGRFCISADDVCDFVNDCGDGSDETYCIKYNRCDFEKLLSDCGIQVDNNHKTNLEWTIRNGHYSLGTFDPKIDNTERSSFGHYFVLEPNSANSDYHQSSYADFYSPMFTTRVTKSTTSCRLRFFYFFNGIKTNITSTRLEVLVWYTGQHQPEIKPILVIKRIIQQRWLKAIAQFDSITRPFQFVFRGYLGESNLTRVALDDITYDPGCVAVNPADITTTTTTPATTENSDQSSSSPTHEFTTKSTSINPSSSPDSRTKLILIIVVPLVTVTLVTIVYYLYHKYRSGNRTDEHLALSMKNLQSKYE